MRCPIFEARKSSPSFAGDAMSQNPQSRGWPAAAFGLSCLVLVGLISGCGRGSGPALAPVSGKVTVDGQALTSGNVVLTPEDPKQIAKDIPAPAGQIESNGTYEIQTGGQRGAPLGKYKVTVTPATMPVQGKERTKIA